MSSFVRLKTGCRAASVLVLAAVLAACSSGPKKLEPAPLAPVTALVPARLAWNVNVGTVDPLMTPAVHLDTVVLANAAGAVHALDA